MVTQTSTSPLTRERDGLTLHDKKPRQAPQEEGGGKEKNKKKKKAVLRSLPRPVWLRRTRVVDRLLAVTNGSLD